jgi:molybdopterin-guanine dinucleotide biosynthesis protein A
MNGIILAGGNSSRFGENKAFMEVAGRPLIENIVNMLRDIFAEVIVVAKSGENYKYLEAKIVEDIIPGKGPLSGIHAGLVNSSAHDNFIVACDMPFLNCDLIQFMREKVSGSDVLIPRVRGAVEPLHAFYSKNCIKPIEGRLHAANYKITGFLGEVDTRYIEEGELRAYDPEMRTFANINTQADYQKIRVEDKIGVDS